MEHPPARQVCEDIAVLKEGQEYAESLKAKEEDKIHSSCKGIECLGEEIECHLQQVTSQLETRELTLTAMKNR